MGDAEYRIEIHRRAEKDLRALSRDNWRRVRTVIDSLAFNPRPDGCRKLAASDDIYRVRAGDYRILYQVRDKQLLVLVVRAAHRKDVYRRGG